MKFGYGFRMNWHDIFILPSIEFYFDEYDVLIGFNWIAFRIHLKWQTVIEV